MNFLFENLKNNLDSVSFFIEFEKKINKDEQSFLIFLLVYLAGRSFFNPLGILTPQMSKLLFYSFSYWLHFVLLTTWIRRIIWTLF